MSRRGRLLAIGDIHGCHRALRSLLARLSPNRGDRMVFLGDYIDRGPDPRGVIDTLLAVRRRVMRCTFLMGNHERMLLDVLEGRNLPLYLANGGLVTLLAYMTEGQLRLPASHRRFFNGLQRFHATGSHIFVHAGLRPDCPLSQQTEEDLLWIRDAFLASDADWGKTVVFGHTPMRKPLLQPRRIGLDTGAVYGGVLTACDLHTRRLWQAREPNRD
ncbi:metallophosphoesterase, putative [Syntrophotalea carbinolica DSM 2380]|uniref:Metallophosphoesterase, putative n=1 Tax=Syntrophotalea carbinolica (strain DSM 2380 / NBRC 103641 / GraBd1) TaxID=338963 RepID=Q3A7H2_SYNC1|nr:metallophosphoesterase family protein [Syntrophotalea carbinolica]ABA87672.1 metallophosphoesterase, putative [Syntrophotalea carbinolica DSM 2380]